jgi:hypothetical protein
VVGAVHWGAQITTLRVVLAAGLELVVVGYFWFCWRLVGR